MDILYMLLGAIGAVMIILWLVLALRLYLDLVYRVSNRLVEKYGNDEWEED